MSLDFDDDFLSHDGDSESGDENSPHCLEEVGSPSSSKANSCKAKYKHVPHCEKPPQVVEKRNARERKRVQTVNGAFVRLRKFIPYENRHKRLSKVKTLRKAIEYIDHLQAMLGQDFEGSSTASTPPPPMPSSQAPSVYTGHEDLSTNPMRLPLQLPQENQSVSLMFGQAMSSDNLTSAAEHCYKAPHAFTQVSRPHLDYPFIIAFTCGHTAA